ncbi:MAG: hypothetical protein FWH21_08655 [Kiritimatiellaeota bacterium]|nr:hypothetical protein [Kiritimatiellota bacterium]
MDLELLLTLDISTFARRKKAVSFVIEMLWLILAAEKGFMNQMDDSPQNGIVFADAEFRAAILANVMDSLGDIY